MLELESEQPVAEGGAEVIDDRHDQIEGEKQREEAILPHGFLLSSYVKFQLLRGLRRGSIDSEMAN